MWRDLKNVISGLTTKSFFLPSTGIRRSKRDESEDREECKILDFPWKPLRGARRAKRMSNARTES